MTQVPPSFVLIGGPPKVSRERRSSDRLPVDRSVTVQVEYASWFVAALRPDELATLRSLSKSKRRAAGIEVACVV